VCRHNHTQADFRSDVLPVFTHNDSERAVLGLSAFLWVNRAASHRKALKDSELISMCSSLAIAVVALNGQALQINVLET
jgi:hypothetical protein